MSERSKSDRSTGAGAEAAEGIHGAKTDREPSESNSVDSSETGSADDQAGSEPLVHREKEHRSGYGGAGGKPMRSSDKRDGETGAKH